MINFIPQKKMNGCGIACLAMLFESMNLSLRYNGLVFLLPCPTSLEDISTTLHLFGVKNVVKKYIIRDLKCVESTYTILHLKSLINHHYVIYYQDKEVSYIYDPGKIGKQRLIKKKIEKRWTGYCIILEDFQEVINHKKCYLPYPVKSFLMLFAFYLLFFSLIIF